MKILYDHQIHTLQKYGGISRYFCELMTRFSTNPTTVVTLALRYSFNEHLLGHPELGRYWSRRSSLNDNRCAGALTRAALGNNLSGFALTRALLFVNRRESDRLLDRQDFDLLHPTYYDPYFLKRRGNKPWIITVHDMIHEIFPESFPARDPVRGWKRQLLEEADAVIAVSESTKSDIVQLMKTDPSKIHVIHHGNPFGEVPYGHGDTADPSGFHNPTILFVGNRSGYKNFDLFVRAVAPLLGKDPKLRICCAGGGLFTVRETELFRDLRISTRVDFVQPDDGTMRRLYRTAQAFVFPSAYEGFGLPVLEAFSCGCPAVLSNASSLPEIGGDAALYFDPSDPAGLTDVLEKVLADDALRVQLIKRGHARARQFSWEKAAWETEKVYDAVVNR